MSYHIVSVKERPDLRPKIQRLTSQLWPAFFEGHTIDLSGLQSRRPFRHFQLVFLTQDEEIAAVGRSLPIQWDGTLADLPSGFDGAGARAIEGYVAERAPNTLVAVSVEVDSSLRGKGVSTLVLNALKTLAVANGLTALIVPVRPSKKNLYPLTPIASYADWKQADGSLFDPWLRTHQKLGARKLAIATSSMTFEGTINQWEGWTGLHFPESGQYVVPGALVPIEIDKQQDRGRYVEPNVWMQHPLAA